MQFCHPVNYYTHASVINPSPCCHGAASDLRMNARQQTPVVAVLHRILKSSQKRRQTKAETQKQSEAWREVWRELGRWRRRVQGDARDHGEAGPHVLGWRGTFCITPGNIKFVAPAMRNRQRRQNNHEKNSTKISSAARLRDRHVLAF